MIKFKNLLLFISLLTVSAKMYAQQSMTVCGPMYVCQNYLTPLECAGCNANSFFGAHVVQIDGVYYFDSWNIDPGNYVVSAQCNIGSPPFDVFVLPSQLTVNGQAINNDTLQYCLPSSGLQLGIANLPSGYTVSWSPSYGLNNPNSISPVANPAFTTTYTATVTMPDGNNFCTSQITLIPTQGYNLSLGISNANICAGQTISLSPNSLPSDGSWIITSSAGQSWNVLNLPSAISPSQSTTFTLSIPDNSCSNPVQASVAVHPMPTGTVTPLQEKCVDEVFNLSVQTSSSNQVAWYDQNSQLLGNGAIISQIAQFSQTYSCHITGPYGCSINIALPLTVNPNCCINNSPPPSNFSYTISSDTVWNNVNYTLTNNVIVMPGVTLGIYGSNLKFANLKGIVLQAGADLDIANSNLTNLDNCPHPWKGISAYRPVNVVNGNTDHTDIKIQNSSISHAQYGLAAITLPPTGGALISYNWANINCENVNFQDNFQDMKVMGYGNNQTSIGLSMINCSFKISTNYPNYMTHSNCRVEVGNNNVTAKYEFVNCTFANSKYGFFSGQELVGLIANNANIRVVGNQGYMDGSNVSKFVGFTRGIVMTNSKAIEIAKTDFLNYRNIFVLSNSQIVQIRDCRLLNLPADYWLSTNQNAPFVVGNVIFAESPNNNITNVAYGVYLYNCSAGIEIKDNYFNMNKSFNGFPINSILTANSNATEHGLILYNCSTTSGEIVRNTFTDMKRAVKCQGQNKVDQMYGVKFYCNNFLGNGKDIVVLPQSQNSLIGLPSQQKNLKDPHNSFNHSAESFDDIHNLTASFGYFWVPGVPMNLIFNEAVGVNQNSTLFLFDCFTLSVSQNLSQNKILYQNTWNYWNETKDGGNSSDLITIIESADFQSVLEELYPVIEASPYLSIDALQKSINNQNMPNYLLAQILSYNSSAMSNYELKQDLDNRIVSLTEFEKAIVYQGVNVWSSKDYLFGQLNYLEEEHQRMLNEIRLAPDSLLSQANKDSILHLYVDPSLFYSDFRNAIIDLTMNGDADEAENLFNQQVSNFNLLPSQKLELNQVIAVAHDLSTTALSLEDYNSQNPDLTPISRNLVSHFFGDTLYHHFDIILEEVETRSVSSESISNYKLNSSIYPNPCSESYFTVSVPLGNYSVAIMNEIGQCVYNKIGNMGQSVFVIDAHDFDNGLYAVRLTNVQTGEIFNHKLILQK